MTASHPPRAAVGLGLALSVVLGVAGTAVIRGVEPEAARAAAAPLPVAGQQDEAALAVWRAAAAPLISTYTAHTEPLLALFTEIKALRGARGFALERTQQVFDDVAVHGTGLPQARVALQSLRALPAPDDSAEDVRELADGLAELLDGLDAIALDYRQPDAVDSAVFQTAEGKLATGKGEATVAAGRIFERGLPLLPVGRVDRTDVPMTLGLHLRSAGRVCTAALTRFEQAPADAAGLAALRRELVALPRPTPAGALDQVYARLAAGDDEGLAAAMTANGLSLCADLFFDLGEDDLEDPTVRR